MIHFKNLLIVFVLILLQQARADFSASPTDGIPPLTVRFSGSGVNVSSWVWDFGDGSSSTDQNPVHVYTELGSYTVSLTTIRTIRVPPFVVTEKVTKKDYINVHEQVAPAADFNASQTSGQAPLTVNFSDISVKGSGIIKIWRWNFGDGNSSDLQNPQYVYNAPGNYTISLKVTDNLGGSDSISKTDYISVYLSPVAEFSAYPVQGKMPLSVKFSDESIKGSGDINQWQWDFGDGNTSPNQNPEHVYTVAGTYNVSLSVKDNLKGANSIAKTGYITVKLPTAIDENLTKIPDTYKLAQNFPNPFNPVTTISYQLPEANFVELGVYNLLGKKVATLVSSYQQAGYHLATWNATGFSSGVYWYKLVTNKGISKSKKLILLK